MKNKGFVFGIAAVGIAVLGFFAMQKKNSPSDSSTSSSNSSTADKPSAELSELFVRPHSPRLGNPMARVTVVEWLDPECEACRAFHPAVKRLIKEYSDRVLFVIRYMPYHGGSMYAASALEEAKEAGKFEEALSLLFEKQPEWGSHQNPRSDLIPSYLKTLGIPEEKLQREKVIAKHGEKVKQDEKDGNKVGVRGTPSFFVNNKQVSRLGETHLRKAIEEALSANR